MEIPFDKKIAQVYSKGELIVEKMPEYKDKFLNLFDRIKDVVDKGVSSK